MFLSNVRSIIGKFDELSSTVKTLDPGLACLTETWLDSSVDSSSIHIHGYTLTRSDRVGRRGGGVGIYIKDGISFDVIGSGNVLSVDVEYISLDLLSCHVFVFVMYVPPNLLNSSLQDLRGKINYEIDRLLSLKPNYDVLILGDFNRLKSSEICDDLTLSDIIDQPTRGDNILDHILVSENILSVYDSRGVKHYAPIGKSDHLVICAEPSILNDVPSSARVHTVYDFRKSNLQHLYSRLSQVDWKSLLSSNDDVNAMCLLFNRTFMELIAACIPQRKVTLSSKDKEWLTPLTKSLIDDRWDAYRNKQWSKYKDLQIKVKREIDKCKRLYVDRLKHGNKLWRIVRQITGRNNTGNWHKEISKHGDAAIVANMFADKLEELFKAENNLCFVPTGDCEWNVSVTEDQIHEQLLKLSMKKSTGPDPIPTKLYVEMAPLLVKPLEMIFNACIKQGVYPTPWKVAVISPVPKTSPPNISKFRPVSALSNQAKIFEKLIYEIIRPHFDTNHGNSQHGFRVQHSSTTALIDILEGALSSYDEMANIGTSVVTFDMSAAFDSVDHSMILKKLDTLGFPKGFIKLLSSYLSGRKFMVKVESSLSRAIHMSRGVPQGSVLGPAIFATFIADLERKSLPTKQVIYADDVTLILPLSKNKSDRELNCYINEEIENVENWCTSNKLRLNKEKSRIILCLKNNKRLQIDHSIPVTEKAKILGVTINNKLSWNDHIKDVVSKCNRRLYIIRKAKRYTRKQDLLTLYYAVIRSVMEYACPAFVSLPKALDAKLNRIQRRILKLICDGDISFSQSVKVCSVKERREILSKKLFQKVLANDSHLLSKRLPKRLQNTKHFDVRLCNTTKLEHSFFPFVSILLNNAKYAI